MLVNTISCNLVNTTRNETYTEFPNIQKLKTIVFLKHENLPQMMFDIARVNNVRMISEFPIKNP